MLNKFSEGEVEFFAYEGKISTKLPVFFNPAMELNRDICVDIVKQLNPEKVCCLMDGSGVRSLRLIKEANVKDIVANDLNPEACELIKKNVPEAKVICSDANKCLRDSEGFDYIDIDPFGSPIKFLKNIVASIKHNGVIGITATDIGCLSGRYKGACFRKYFAKSMACPFSKELAARILISKIQSAGAEFEKALVPVFVHYNQHYIRVYLQFKGNLKEVLSNQGFVYYCKKCLKWKVSAKPSGFECCEVDWAGPLWIGKLFDKEFSSDLVPYRSDEIDVVGFYDTHKFAKALKISVPNMDVLQDKISSLGFKVCRTHFCLTALRSDIPYEKFVSLFSK